MARSKRKGGTPARVNGGKRLVAAMRYVWAGNEIDEYDDPFAEVMETINLHLRALHEAGNDVFAHSVILLGRRPGASASDLTLETKCDVRLDGATKVVLPEVDLVGAGEAYEEISATLDEQLVAEVCAQCGENIHLEPYRDDRGEGEEWLHNRFAARRKHEARI
jgi:hypothetical protein